MTSWGDDLIDAQDELRTYILEIRWYIADWRTWILEMRLYTVDLGTHIDMLIKCVYDERPLLLVHSFATIHFGLIWIWSFHAILFTIYELIPGEYLIRCLPLTFCLLVVLFLDIESKVCMKFGDGSFIESFALIFCMLVWKKTKKNQNLK